MKELDVDYRNLVLDNIREGILILDSELNFVFINQVFELTCIPLSQSVRPENITTPPIREDPTMASRKLRRI